VILTIPKPEILRAGYLPIAKLSEGSMTTTTVTFGFWLLTKFSRVNPDYAE